VRWKCFKGKGGAAKGSREKVKGVVKCTFAVSAIFDPLHMFLLFWPKSDTV
jgi:hypothetical protein